MEGNRGNEDTLGHLSEGLHNFFCIVRERVSIVYSNSKTWNNPFVEPLVELNKTKVVLSDLKKYRSKIDHLVRVDHTTSN